MSPDALVCTSPASVRNEDAERVRREPAKMSAIKIAAKTATSNHRALKLLRLGAADPVGMAMGVGIVAVALAGAQPRWKSAVECSTAHDPMIAHLGPGGIDRRLCRVLSFPVARPF